MLIVKYKNLDIKEFINKYSENVCFVDIDRTSNDWLIKCIENIKHLVVLKNMVIIDYAKELILAFNALKLDYAILLPKDLSTEEYDQNKEEYDNIKALSASHDLFNANANDIEEVFSKLFDWIKLDVDITTVSDTNETANIVNNSEVTAEPVNETSVSTTEDVVDVDAGIVEVKRQPLTFKELVENDDVEITDADIRDMKALTNKFKVTMLLQAKSRLKTVLKLCDVLDKLYDELVNRIDVSLATSDTASIMYTADYIAKALNDTNQFIMPLINNEKLQNFFIIDNSNVVSVSDSRVDINKREKIRKAAEIVLDNIDYFAGGEYSNLMNPNNTIIDISEDKKE